MFRIDFKHSSIQDDAEMRTHQVIYESAGVWPQQVTDGKYFALWIRALGGLRYLILVCHHPHHNMLCKDSGWNWIESCVQRMSHLLWWRWEWVGEWQVCSTSYKALLHKILILRPGSETDWMNESLCETLSQVQVQARFCELDPFWEHLLQTENINRVNGGFSK